MDKDIYLGLLLYKNIIEDNKQKHLSFKVLGPMMGTINNNIFINTSNKEYKSINNKELINNNKERYAYFNIKSLYELKKEYKEDHIEKIVEKYYELEKDTSYYVISELNKESTIIRYNKDII